MDLLDYREGRDYISIGLVYTQYISTVVIPYVRQRRLVQEYTRIELVYIEYKLG